jgi:hypothetical protein
LHEGKQKMLVLVCLWHDVTRQPQIPGQLLPTTQFSLGIFTTRGPDAVAPGAVKTTSFRAGPSRASSGCVAPTGSWVPRREGASPRWIADRIFF